MTIRTATYTVPPGQVGILRSFRYQLLPQVQQPGVAAVVTSTLFVNSIAVPDYQNMTLGQSMVEPFPCHVLGAAGHVFKLKVDVPDGLIAVGDSAVVVYFYGNMLLAKQVPLPYEVGEEVPVNALPLDGTTKPTIAPRPGPRSSSTLRLPAGRARRPGRMSRG